MKYEDYFPPISCAKIIWRRPSSRPARWWLRYAGPRAGLQWRRLRALNEVEARTEAAQFLSERYPNVDWMIVS
jgi:hypothetical protein